MLKQFLILLVLASLITIQYADAHSAKVVGDFKLDVGWETEPPMAGVENAIELIVTLAGDYEKQSYDPIYFNLVDDSQEQSTKKNLSGLEDSIEIDVKLGSEKTFLEIAESEEFPGVYHGKFTPKEAGRPHVHLYGVIKNMEFEATFDVEKVEENTTPEISYVIPEWVRNNALWWSENQIADTDFISGLQFLIKEDIIQVPQTDSVEAAANEIPAWIKNNAGWWAQNQISDGDFVKGIQFLIQNGIIQL